MKTTYNKRSLWTLWLLVAFLWIPVGSIAQSTQFEMVVEKTDGTSEYFLITSDFPTLNYYDDSYGTKQLQISTAEGVTTIDCSAIKRLYTLTVTESSGISDIILQGQKFDVYNLQGQMVRSRASSIEVLPRGVYIINKRKVQVR